MSMLMSMVLLFSPKGAGLAKDAEERMLELQSRYSHMMYRSDNKNS